jgi:hypothetical protein
LPDKPSRARRVRVLRLLAPALVALAPDAELVQLCDGAGKPLHRPLPIVRCRPRPPDPSDDDGQAAPGRGRQEGGAAPGRREKNFRRQPPGDFRRRGPPLHPLQ